MGKLQSNEWLRQQAIHARCFHPTGTCIEFPASALAGSVVERFEQMVRQFPNQMAVKMDDEQLTYGELNRAANRLAHTILACRGPAAEPIAVIMRLEIKAVITILGILKAGKFYTAPDLQHPVDRIKLMLQNAQAPLLITNNRQVALAQQLCDEGSTILNLDALDLTATQSTVGDNNPGLSLTPDSLFFITYTSGTTGQPKGIYCNQRTALQRIQRFVNHAHLSNQDRLACTHYPGFTPRDLFGPLLTGGTLYLFDLQVADISQLINWLRQEQITIFGLAVAVLRRLLSTLNAPDSLPHVRLIMAGSEALQKTDLLLFQQRCAPHCCLNAAYGMTEALGGFQTFWVDQQSIVEGDRIPSGYSQDGFEILILDEAGRQLPANMTGEVVVRSQYLALGYWLQPELTAQRFHPDPTAPSHQRYFTGDQGFLLPDGCLIHLGRKDDQLKIRGYLVEPIEVERALLGLGYYREAVVGARPNRQGEVVLVAWLVAHPEAPSVTSVRRRLAETLPDYMIPAAFVMLDQLPLTPARKIDHKALPAPLPERPTIEAAFVAPRTPNEQSLADIWREVLAIDSIGVDDPFLELGGNSLQASQIIVRILKHFQVQLPMQTLFAAPTIGAMTRVIEQIVGSLAPENPLGGNRELEQLLTKIELLSEHEAAQLLQGKETSRG